MNGMDLGAVDKITTDAVGEPGMRTFYLQARSGPELVTVIVEKQQVQLLAASVLELLTTLGIEAGDVPEDQPVNLDQPIEPRWRAGRLALGFDEMLAMFTLEIEEYRPEDGDDEEEAEAEAESATEAETIRLLATRPQMLALSRQGAEVVARGRPTCQFCGNPMDPEGHACPAMNGHSRR
jgi:uncharacterized repeat protein (TIGR03847 family)